MAGYPTLLVYSSRGSPVRDNRTSKPAISMVVTLLTCTFSGRLTSVSRYLQNSNKGQIKGQAQTANCVMTAQQHSMLHILALHYVRLRHWVSHSSMWEIGLKPDSANFVSFMYGIYKVFRYTWYSFISFICRDAHHIVDPLLNFTTIKDAAADEYAASAPRETYFVQRLFSYNKMEATGF